MAYWLFKTEPDAFSIDDLKNTPEQTSMWDGVRNYQARNFMRDDMKQGDLVMIYHSSCKAVGVVGIATITRDAYPDPTQFDLNLLSPGRDNDFKVMCVGASVEE